MCLIKAPLEIEEFSYWWLPLTSELFVDEATAPTNANSYTIDSTPLPLTRHVQRVVKFCAYFNITSYLTFPPQAPLYTDLLH